MASTPILLMSDTPGFQLNGKKMRLFKNFFTPLGVLAVVGGFGGSIAISPIAQADIYAYTDKNGVRHISNRRTDSRYRLVMRTPKYKKVPVAPATAPLAKAATAPATADTDAGTGNIQNIQINGSNWKLIRPSADRNSSLAALHSGQIHWSYRGKKGKPFRVNEKKRRELSPHIKRIAAKHRLDPHLIHAVISAESAFNPRAVSHAGAMGLMQLMPGTAKRFGVQNPFDPVANINGGARYLRWLLNHFKNDLKLALAGYNAGENAVKKYGHKIPPYKETQTYVGRVLRFYNHYRTRRSS